MTVCVLPAKRWTSDWWLQLLLLIVWGNYLITFLRGIILRLPFISNFVDQIEILIYIVPLLFALPSVLKKIKIYDICFYLSVLAVVALSYLNVNNIEILDDNVFRICITAVPYYFVGRFLNFDKLDKSMLLISEICIILDCYYRFFFIQNAISNAESHHEYMDEAYRILPHVLLVIGFLFRSKSLTLIKLICRVTLTIMGLFLILSYGTRGPFLCLTIFTLCMIMFYGESKSKPIIISVILLASTLIYVNYDSILLSLTEIVDDAGMATRILDKLIDDEITDDSHRGVIQQPLWEVLNRENRIFGYGVLGAWHYMGGAGYPHHVYLELFFSFGYIGGSIALLAFGILTYRGLKFSTPNQRILFFLLFCWSFVKLNLTGSFIWDYPLYFYIGYCMNIIQVRNDKYKHRNHAPSNTKASINMQN